MGREFVVTGKHGAVIDYWHEQVQEGRFTFQIQVEPIQFVWKDRPILLLVGCIFLLGGLVGLIRARRNNGVGRYD